MARIRKVEISNFRGIRQLVWRPDDGINCLIGPGDSGKSTVLDAIDICLGARRSFHFTDADFHGLDVNAPIDIRLTIGALDDALKNIESYGPHLRNFNAETGEVLDEPDAGHEVVLTVKMTVDADLEPAWTLHSDAGAAEDQEGRLRWSDRTRLAPVRIGGLSERNLTWQRGSVLNRITEEQPDISLALANAAREARNQFGNTAAAQLQDALDRVKSVSDTLGIPVGDNVTAMMDAHSVSITGGTVSVHDADGVPLRGLGLGSSRLLVAGLQGEVGEISAPVLVDELEHGLEPHRIIRLLDALGAKAETPQSQAFVTTHSPVALRELSAKQLHIIRDHGDHHEVTPLGSDGNVQGMLRLYPEAFLARSVMVCEGASEVGLVRGLDQWRVANGETALAAQGISLVDAHGVGQVIARARPLLNLGYRVSILRDDDMQPDPAAEQEFTDNGGAVFTWTTGDNAEKALFSSLPVLAVGRMLEYAIELLGEALIRQHIMSLAGSTDTLDTIRTAISFGSCEPAQRQVLGEVASNKSNSWFKEVYKMEHVGREIVGPNLGGATPEFNDKVNAIFDWIEWGE